MLDEMKEWIESILASAFVYAKGQFIDSEAMADKSVCSIRAFGGAAIDVDDRRPRFRIVLFGPRGERSAVSMVQAAAESLVQGSLGATAPCGAAAVRTIGEPVGPGFTAENRAWFSLDLQVTF